MMLRSFRREWPINWITVLLPALSTLGCYLVQVFLLGAMPGAVAFFIGAAAGTLVGVLRGVGHRLEMKNGAVYARKTSFYLAVWFICFLFTQTSALMGWQALARIGMTGSTFSTAIVVAMSAALGIRFFFKRVASRRLPASASGLAALLVLLASVVPAAAQQRQGQERFVGQVNPDYVQIISQAIGSVGRLFGGTPSQVSMQADPLELVVDWQTGIVTANTVTMTGTPDAAHTNLTVDTVTFYFGEGRVLSDRSIEGGGSMVNMKADGTRKSSPFQWSAIPSADGTEYRVFGASQAQLREAQASGRLGGRDINSLAMYIVHSQGAPDQGAPAGSSGTSSSSSRADDPLQWLVDRFRSFFSENSHLSETAQAVGLITALVLMVSGFSMQLAMAFAEAAVSAAEEGVTKEASASGDAATPRPGSPVDPQTGRALPVQDGSYEGGRTGQVWYDGQWMDPDEARRRIDEAQHDLSEERKRRQAEIDGELARNEADFHQRRRDREAQILAGGGRWDAGAQAFRSGSPADEAYSERLAQADQLSSFVDRNVKDPVRAQFYQDAIDRVRLQGGDLEALRNAIKNSTTGAEQQRTMGDNESAAAEGEAWSESQQYATDVRDWTRRANRMLGYIAPAAGGTINNVQAGLYGAIDGYDKDGIQGALSSAAADIADNAIENRLGIKNAASALRNQFYCPGCGRPMGVGIVMCEGCGTRREASTPLQQFAQDLAYNQVRPYDLGQYADRIKNAGGVGDLLDVGMDAYDAGRSAVDQGRKARDLFAPGDPHHATRDEDLPTVRPQKADAASAGDSEGRQAASGGAGGGDGGDGDGSGGPKKDTPEGAEIRPQKGQDETGTELSSDRPSKPGDSDETGGAPLVKPADSDDDASSPTDVDPIKSLSSHDLKNRIDRLNERHADLKSRISQLPEGSPERKNLMLERDLIQAQRIKTQREQLERTMREGEGGEDSKLEQEDAIESHHDASKGDKSLEAASRDRNYTIQRWDPATGRFHELTVQAEDAHLTGEPTVLAPRNWDGKNLDQIEVAGGRQLGTDEVNRIKQNFVRQYQQGQVSLQRPAPEPETEKPVYDLDADKPTSAKVTPVAQADIPDGVRTDVRAQMQVVQPWKDDEGKIHKEFSGTLGHPDQVLTHRDEAAQEKVRELAREQLTARGMEPTRLHAAHLGGNQFGCPGGEDNLVVVPQTINESYMKDAENMMASLIRDKGAKVELKTTAVTYPDTVLARTVKYDIKATYPDGRVENLGGSEVHIKMSDYETGAPKLGTIKPPPPRRLN